MKTAVEQNRQGEYERYEKHRRFEEATDIAERIGYSIDHTVRYEMRDGLLHGAFDTKNRPFRAQTEQSLREGRELFHGVNRFEVTRREHEHQEALLIDQFGRGELDGTVLVKISPVPDAVRDGTADIDGYRRDMLRSFVRIYYRADGDVVCRLFSLDQTDPVGMAAVGDLLGIDVDGRSSEDILGDHALMDMESVSHEAIDELVEGVKKTYDSALEMQTGERYRAGSRLKNQSDALSLVTQHSALLDEHMRGVSDIMSQVLDEGTKKDLLEERRKRTSAAIDYVLQGGVIDSSNDSAVTEQMSTKDYGGECATGSVANAVGMAQGAKKEREWKKGVCVACLKEGTVGECAVCRDCESADNRGVDLMKRREKALRVQSVRQAIERRQAARSEQLAWSWFASAGPSKADQIKLKYGRHAEERKGAKSFGYQTTVIVNRYNGQVIDEY